MPQEIGLASPAAHVHPSAQGLVNQGCVCRPRYAPRQHTPYC
jgi:hypothetical protein